ncbi:unnamed protein product [Blepharisma stoltei]|uniref:PAS domain-containing protein n=1 Tax=Blepharisma stoltei TaxID=1481888 RepID=A0AAU9J5U3_9CILI|nr:unnamed protein product [Blepharisma stoltei]
MFFHSAGYEKEYLENHEHLSEYFKTSKNYFFEFFGKMFDIEYSDKLSYKLQLKYEIAINISITLQAASIIWYPNPEISDWSSYKQFWNMIGIINYDLACALLGLLEFCYYGTVFAIGTCFSYFVIFFVFFYLEKSPPKILVAFSIKIVKIISTICFIPSIMILLTVLKYSIISSNSVDELDNTDTKILDFGTIGIIISIFCLIVLIAMAILYEFFTCDINHANFKKNIKARSFATLDCQRQIFFVFMCISYVSFGKKYSVYHQIICFLSTFLLGIKSIRFLHYFNYIENAIQVCKMGSISLTLLIFIFGELLDNSLIILVFTLILHPILLIFLIKFTQKNYNNLSSNTETPNNQFDFEKKFRSLLTTPNIDDKYQIIKLFSKHWKVIHFDKNKLFVLWEFYFCISIINDQRLARVKLTKLALCETSFEGDIQEWRVYNFLKNKVCTEFPEIMYLDYIQEVQMLKEHDEELCNLIIQLQTEFASRAPLMRSLINLSTKTSKILKKVSEGYKFAAEKYKNTETLEIYASYLENILKNRKEANLIRKKKNGIEYSYQRDIGLEKYGNHAGILIISCQEGSFGHIIYLNEKASEILKVSMADIHGSSIFNFYPHSYGKNHEKLMRKFIHHSKTVEVPNHHNLFFQSQFGFLSECKMVIKLTAFHNCCYYLISFQQKRTQRQFALISDEGIIQGHSEYFSFYLGYNSKYVKNVHISAIFPFIDADNLKVNQPWLEKIQNKEVCLIYTKKIMKSKTLNVLFVIDNWIEAQKLKEGDEPKTFISLKTGEIIEDNYQINETFLENKETSKPLISFKSVEASTPKSYEIDDNSPQSRLSSDNKMTKSYSSTILKQSQDLIIQSKKKIKALKWVLFIVTLTVILTMVSIMANIVSDVNLTSSMMIFRNLGNLLYNIGLTADSARTIDKSKMFNLDYSSQKAPFLSILQEIQTIQNTILSDFENWEFCSVSDIIYDPLIPIWSFDGKSPKIQYENMYNTLEIFLLHARSMMDALNNNKTYKTYAKFLILNGLGQTYDYFNHTILSLEDCAVNQIESIGDVINTLLIWGFFTLGILLAIIFVFIYLAARKIDEFWNFFIKNLQIPMMKLKSEAMERLIYAHNTEANPEDSASSSRIKKKRKVRTWIEINFTWKILLFIIISASYYFLLYFYLYPDCQSYMTNRPKLLNVFNIRRSLVSRLSIFARDLYSPYFSKTFLSSYGFPNSSYMMYLNAEILKEKNKELRKGKFMKIMSGQLKQRIFESSNLTSPILKFGSETAVEISSYDTINVAYSPSLPPAVVLNYVSVLKVVQNYIDIEFQLADHDSHIIIDSQLNIIIAATIIYSVIFCGLFFIYYLPFLQYQIKVLNWLSFLIEVIAAE